MIELFAGIIILYDEGSKNLRNVGNTSCLCTLLSPVIRIHSHTEPLSYAEFVFGLLSHMDKRYSAIADDFTRLTVSITVF